MDRDLRAEIIAILDEHRLMTIATIRRDGWPQATVVSYANDGLFLYSVIGRNTQKYLNIVLDPRVSVSMSNDVGFPFGYKGLSLGGHATILESRTEIDRVCAMVLRRNPQYDHFPTPDPTMIAVLCFKPEFVSIIDYSKGFGHSDLVRVLQDQKVELVEALRHHWLGLKAA